MHRLRIFTYGWVHLSNWHPDEGKLTNYAETRGIIRTGASLWIDSLGKNIVSDTLYHVRSSFLFVPCLVMIRLSIWLGVHDQISTVAYKIHLVQCEIYLRHFQSKLIPFSDLEFLNVPISFVLCSLRAGHLWTDSHFSSVSHQFWAFFFHVTL